MTTAESQLASEADREVLEAGEDLPPQGRFGSWVRQAADAAARLCERVSSAWRRPQPIPTLRFPEPAGYPLRIGRAPNCGLRLGDDTVSRMHAVLYNENDHWFLRDLRSMNGTTVNGSRISTAEVHTGDHLGFGAAVFRLVDR